MLKNKTLMDVEYGMDIMNEIIGKMRLLHVETTPSGQKVLQDQIYDCKLTKNRK